VLLPRLRRFRLRADRLDRCRRRPGPERLRAGPVATASMAGGDPAGTVGCIASCKTSGSTNCGRNVGARVVTEELDAMTGGDAETEMAMRLDLAVVRRRIADLSPDQRAVLLLVSVDGLSYKEGRRHPRGTDRHGDEPSGARARLALARALEPARDHGRYRVIERLQGNLTPETHRRLRRWRALRGRASQGRRGHRCRPGSASHGGGDAAQRRGRGSGFRRGLARTPAAAADRPVCRGACGRRSARHRLCEAAAGRRHGAPGDRRFAGGAAARALPAAIRCAASTRRCGRRATARPIQRPYGFTAALYQALDRGRPGDSIDYALPTAAISGRVTLLGELADPLRPAVPRVQPHRQARRTSRARRTGSPAGAPEAVGRPCCPTHNDPMASRLVGRAGPGERGAGPVCRAGTGLAVIVGGPCRQGRRW